MSKTCEKCIHYEVCRYPLEYRAFPDTCWKYEEPRPQGEWVESKERKGHFYCSECIQQDAAGKWRELFDYKYNFCPNCGSDNRKKEDKPHGS